MDFLLDTLRNGTKVMAMPTLAFFPRMLTGFLAVRKQCTVFVVPQPENLEDYNGFAHATSDVDRKKSMKTIGIEDEGDYLMATSRAWGILLYCVQKFPDITAIVSIHHGDFTAAILAIKDHVTGEVESYIVGIKEQVHSRFNGVVTKLDLRHAISFLQQQQIILDKVDSVSHKCSDSESRNFLLSALKKPSVKLLDIYRRTARTHGETTNSIASIN